MKSLVWVVVVLVCTGFMPVLAVEPPENPGSAVLCVFTDTGLPAENYLENVVAFTGYRLYFVLYYPAEHPDGIVALEFGWDLQPPVNHLAALEYPPELGVIGDHSGNPHDPWLDFAPYFIDGDHAYFCSVWIYFLTDPGATHLLLRTNLVDPALPDYMRYGWFDWKQWPYSFDAPMLPYSEDFSLDNPVFGFNVQPVATEAQTWGGVKALFSTGGR